MLPEVVPTCSDRQEKITCAWELSEVSQEPILLPEAVMEIPGAVRDDPGGATATARSEKRLQALLHGSWYTLDRRWELRQR